jgi:ATP-dependent protease ClpP protease subunit
MTIRKLPELRTPEVPANIGFDIEPRALAAWDPNVTAADEEEMPHVISILDYIGENWDGSGITARSVSGRLRNLGSVPVTVLINSPGGNVFEGLAIYNLLRSHPAPVTVQIIGIAASIASVVAMAGDTIQIGKAGMVMVHNTQWVAMGDKTVMLKAHDTMVVFDETLATLYVDRTGNALPAVVAMMEATTFMSGTDAVEKGFADEFLPADSVGRTATNELRAHQPVAYKIEAALAKAGVPRTERRKLLKEITGGTPSAAHRDGKPRAAETPTDLVHLDRVSDGEADLSLALARFRLAQIPA